MEHLVLVVHGIGDALMSVDLGVVQLRSLVECCDTMRAHHEEVRCRGGLAGRAWFAPRKGNVGLGLCVLVSSSTCGSTDRVWYGVWGPVEAGVGPTPVTAKTRERARAHPHMTLCFEDPYHLIATFSTSIHPCLVAMAAIQVMMNSKHLRGLRKKVGVGGGAARDGNGGRDRGKGRDEGARCGYDEEDEEEEKSRPRRQRQPPGGSGAGDTHRQPAAPEDQHPNSCRSNSSSSSSSSTDTSRSKRTAMDTGREHLDGDRVGGGELPNGLGRVEYLPVEWHTRFKGRLYREGGGRERGDGDRDGSGGSRRGAGEASSPSFARGSEGGGGERSSGGGGVRGRSGGDGGSGDGLSIWDITLPRAPTLRAFTNDTLLDILYFMSPEYHQARGTK